MTQQARNFFDARGRPRPTAADRGEKSACLMRDRNTKCAPSFDDVLKAEGVKVKALPDQSPNLNSRCERVIQSIKQECLENFLVFGEQHLNYLVREYVVYYNDQRAHSACGHQPPLCADPPAEYNTIVLEDIIRRERLGGLIQWLPVQNPLRTEYLFLQRDIGIVDHRKAFSERSLRRVASRAGDAKSALREEIQCRSPDFWLTDFSLFALTGVECQHFLAVG